MAPIRDNLKSVLVYPESATSPTAGTPKCIVVDNSTATTVGSADFTNTADSDNVLLVLEPLDGDCKGQFVLIKSFDSATDIATTTAFRKAPASFTKANLWDFNIPRAVVTTNSTANTEVFSSLRTEADDYWNQYKLLMFDGADVADGLVNISDFANSTDEFTVAAMAALPVVGDACIPVQPIQPKNFSITVNGGVPLERQVITDTLAQEGIIIGAQDGGSVTVDVEIRGLASAAGDNDTAVAPDECHVFMDAVFDKSLGTGGVVGSVTNATTFGITNAAFDTYDIAMVNGEAFGITDNSTITIGSHLSAAPTAGDEIFAGCCYKPKDTGQTSVGIMHFLGGEQLALLTGCMPSIGVSCNGGEIASYNMNLVSGGGFWTPHTKTHDDVYDTTQPIAVKSNISRIIIDGSELDADMLGLSGELISPPEKKKASFSAFEDCGGYSYTSRSAQLSIQLYMQDSTYWARYRALDELDLFVQIGKVQGNIWALWTPRAQIIETPAFAADGGLSTQTLVVRALRPSTAGQPDLVLFHG